MRPLVHPAIPLAFVLGGAGMHLALSRVLAPAPAGEGPAVEAVDWDRASMEQRTRFAAKPAADAIASRTSQRAARRPSTAGPVRPPAPSDAGATGRGAEHLAGAPGPEAAASSPAPATPPVPRLLAAPLERARAAVLAPGQEPDDAAPADAREADASAEFDAADTIAWAAPSERDLLHRTVDWHAAVIDGVLEAQTEDKPLLLWLYFGGPLDDC